MCRIRICFTIVLFPLSPAPSRSSRWVARITYKQGYGWVREGSVTTRLFIVRPVVVIVLPPAPGAATNSSPLAAWPPKFAARPAVPLPPLLPLPPIDQYFNDVLLAFGFGQRLTGLMATLSVLAGHYNGFGRSEKELGHTESGGRHLLGRQRWPPNGMNHSTDPLDGFDSLSTHTFVWRHLTNYMI